MRPFDETAPSRKIVDFVLDEQSQWVARLSCGHGQHVRHEPPLQSRPWVVSVEGRQSHVGTTLQCMHCLAVQSPVPTDSQGKQFCRILGVTLVLVSPAYAWASWTGTQQPLEVLAQVEQRGNILDSATIGSAMYHAAHARATLADRWHPTGFATLGVIGTIVGATFLFFSRARRTG